MRNIIAEKIEYSTTTQHRLFNRNDPMLKRRKSETTDEQAEVLVYNNIPKSYIMDIVKL